MGKNQRRSYADQDLVSYATKKNVSISDIAKHIGLNDGEFYSILHNPMSATRRYEIKRAIDDLSETKITESEVKTEEFSIDDLTFTVKSLVNHRGCGAKDIYASINITKTKFTQYEYVSFSIRNGAHRIISSTDYASVAVYKNRVYFKEDTPENGYKIAEVKGTRPKCLKICNSPTELVELIKGNIGEYDLKKDERLGLYYIEVE